MAWNSAKTKTQCGHNQSMTSRILTNFIISWNKRSDRTVSSEAKYKLLNEVYNWSHSRRQSCRLTAEAVSYVHLTDSSWNLMGPLICGSFWAYIIIICCIMVSRSFLQTHLAIHKCNDKPNTKVELKVKNCIRPEPNISESHHILHHNLKRTLVNFFSRLEPWKIAHRPCHLIFVHSQLTRETALLTLCRLSMWRM